MSWDDVVASIESTHCCFCGTDFDNLWDLRYQLHSPKTDAPLNLWCCDSCVPIASGYRVRLDTAIPPRPEQPSRRRRVLVFLQIFALAFPVTISALIAFAIVTGLLATGYFVYLAVTQGWF